MPRNDDLSLILAKAKDRGFFPDIPDSEVDYWTQRAKALFGNDATMNFDETVSVYNLKPKHLYRAKAAIAKAQAGTGFFRLATLGDSTVAGLSTTNAGTKPWPVVLKNLLDKYGIPSGGTGLVPAMINFSGDLRWTIGAGWVPFHSAGSAIRMNSSTSNALVFASDSTGTIVRVHYTQASNSPFTVAIDGGAAITVTPTGNSSDRFGTYEVTGLADTTHTVSIVRTGTGSQTCYIYGVEVRKNATYGTLLFNGGISGNTSANLALTNFWNMDVAVNHYAADLIIIRMQTNNTNHVSIPHSTYKTEMLAAVASAKSLGASVILVTAAPSNGKDFTETTKMLYEVADEADVPLIDHHYKFGTYAIHGGLMGLMADSLHPNDAGHAAEALSVFKVLTS